MSLAKSVVQIVERVRRCKYCGREMKVGALAYEENPHCTVCFDDRVRSATSAGEVLYRRAGHYVEFFTKGS